MSITINGTLVGAEIDPDDGRTVVKVHVDGGSGSGAQVVDGQIIVVFDGPAALGELAFGGDVVISVEAAPVEAPQPADPAPVEAQPAPEPIPAEAPVEAPVEPTPTEVPAEPLPTVLTPGGPAVAEAPAPEPAPVDPAAPETPIETPVETPPVDPMAPAS